MSWGAWNTQKSWSHLKAISTEVQKIVAMVTWQPTFAHLWCSHATVQHISHTVPGNGFKLLASGFHRTMPNNQHYLMLWPSSENVPVLILLNKKKKQYEHHFSHHWLHSELIFPYHTPVLCSMESSSGTIFHPHHRYISRSHHFHFYSVSKHTNRCKCLHLCSSVKCFGTHLAETLWTPSLRMMISWSAHVLLLHQKPPFCNSESWHGLVQCSDQ
jgi:hypothetical protein